MLENESWSHLSERVFSEYLDSDFNKQRMRLATTDAKINSQFLKSENMNTIGSELCANNTIGVGISNDHREDDFNDFFPAAWPNTVSLEDANNMFRSVDSTFGCGEFDNEDGFNYILSKCMEESDAVIKSGSRLLYPESSSSKHKVEKNGSSEMVNMSSSDSEFNCSLSTTSTDKAQTNIHNQSEGKLSDQSIGYCASSYDSDIAYRAFISGVGPQSSGYLQSGTPFPQSTNSGINFTTLSSPAKQLSNVINGVELMDCSPNLSFEAPAISTDDYREKSPYRYLNNYDSMDAANYNPTSVLTQAYYSEVENRSELQGTAKGLKVESSDVPETSSLSSELDATTLEASRLCQLQQVMHQLDIRTKLCLRDGLYRLARSAEQRRSSASANGRSIDAGDINGTEGIKKSNELMEIETETNLMDRFIAHLLFYRSTDPSANSTRDGLSLKSHTMNDGFIDSSTLIDEKVNCGRETF